MAEWIFRQLTDYSKIIINLILRSPWLQIPTISFILKRAAK